MHKLLSILILILLGSCANYSLLQQKQASVGVVVRCDTGPSSVGSGVIISNKYIVTAKHVLKCKSDIYTVFIKTYSGDTIRVSSDKESKDDVARLFASSYDFRGNIFFSETVSINEKVCAIFANRGYKQSCGEIVKKTKNRLFVDMDVDFGDSGSPVFNVDGQVVGIVVARTYGLVEAIPVQAWRELLITSEPNMFGEWP